MLNPMRKATLAVLIVITFLLVILLYLFFLRKGNALREEDLPRPRQGVAVILTGAAARIPQEAALLEELDDRGLLNDLVFISGVSSGALNAEMLNGIISQRMTWSEYKKILYDLKTSDIFIQEGKKIPVNTTPARELYKRVVEDRMGYYSIGDLPITTSISFTHIENLYLKKNVYRMCSRKINEESDTTLSLVDIMMASSAFPVAFPPVRISHVHTIPDTEFIDGGMGEDHVPYRSLLEFEKYRGAGVAKVYFVSRQSDSIPEVSEELSELGINDKGLFDSLGISLDAFLQKEINKRLKAYAKEAPELVPLSYVWIPVLNAEFPLFDFDDLEKQYELTSRWAKTHDPEPLEEYLQKTDR